jgi:adenosylmethionine---8-amino-7-oxononanoate aminotransferase
LTEEQQTQRYGYQVFQHAVQEGALLRPLGNTIYWLPPLNISRKDLQKLQAVTIWAINMTF